MLCGIWDIGNYVSMVGKSSENVVGEQGYQWKNVSKFRPSQSMFYTYNVDAIMLILNSTSSIWSVTGIILETKY